MSQYITCPECNGREVVEREVRVHTMNSGGFAFIEIECPRCHGEGEIEVEDTIPLRGAELRSLTEAQEEVSTPLVIDIGIYS